MSSDATGVGALLVAVPSVEELPADAGRLLLDDSSPMGRARFFLEAKKDVIMVEEDRVRFFSWYICFRVIVFRAGAQEPIFDFFACAFFEAIHNLPE